MSDSDDDFQPDPRSRLKSGKKPAAATLQSVPVGHCLVNRKWKNTITGQNISKLFTVKYVEDLGVMDCQLGANLYSVVLLEGDIIAGTGGLKVKLEKCAEMSRGRPEITTVFLFTKTEMTSQYFQEYQKEIVLNNGHSIVPITHVDQVAQVLQQFQLAHNRSNPFRGSPKTSTESQRNIHKDILLSVTKVPGLGEMKSRKLLTTFDSLKKISKAKESDMKKILGPNIARGVEDFFKRKNLV